MPLSDWFKQKPSATDDPMTGTLLKHLARMHGHFKHAPQYPNTAHFWRQLEDPGLLQQLSLEFQTMAGKGNLQERAWSAGPINLIFTTVPEIHPERMRRFFSPDGYLSYLEGRGFFDRVRLEAGTPSVNIIMGIASGSALRADVSFLPPLDGKPYVVVWAQDLMTPAELRELHLQ